MSQLVGPTSETTIDHECQIASEHLGPVCVVHVAGHLDWATAPQFRDRMRDQKTDPKVIIDLSRTTRMDSAGNGALLATAAEAVRRSQQLAVVSVDPVEVEVLRYFDLNNALPIFGTQTEALRWLGDDCPVS